MISGIKSKVAIMTGQSPKTVIIVAKNIKVENILKNKKGALFCLKL
jgi:hypothetical protein